jgi:ATP-binding protein involved in chromosome partitioning
MHTLSEDVVGAAIAGVMDPVFGRAMTAIGTLSIASIDGDHVKLAAKLPAPSADNEKRVRERVESVLRPLSPSTIEIAFTIEVPTREVMGDDPIPGVKNVILVMSGKGGVGKSTTAVNLTLALKHLGMRVGLLDADVYGPSIPTMMGVSGSPRSRDGKTIAPHERFGVKMMSIGFMLEDEKQAIVWRGPMLHSALTQLLRDVDWGTLDALVLDLPPGTGDVALTMAQKLKVTGVVMVTTPQEVALADVYKAVSMCGKLNLPILGVVENMSWFVDPAGNKHELFGRGGGEKIAEFAKAPLLARIPIVTTVREWGDKGMPIVEAEPASEPAKTFLALAERVTEAFAQHHFARTGGERAPAGKGPTHLKIVR